MTNSFIKVEANGTLIQFKPEITLMGKVDLNEFGTLISYTQGLDRDIGKGARVGGTTHYQPWSFTIKSGPSTPMIMQSLERGHTLQTTVIVCGNDDDGDEVQYMEARLSEGRFGSFDQSEGESAGGRVLIDHFTIHYHKMEFDWVWGSNTSAIFDWSGASQG